MFEVSQIMSVFIYAILVALPIIYYVKYEMFNFQTNKKKALKDELFRLTGMIFLCILGAKLAIRLVNGFEMVPPEILLGCTFIALIPASIWLYFVYHKRVHNLKKVSERKYERNLLFAIFLLGTLTVPLLNTWYEFLAQNPQYNYYSILYESIVKPFENALNATPEGSQFYYERYFEVERLKNTYNTITIIIDAFLEEIVKISLLVIFAKSMKIIKTISDAIAFSVLAGLGFAFIENILFFTDVYLSSENSSEVFLNVVIFRTLVLSIGHMTFSGIFGYFYGLSKFGQPLYLEQKWEGHKFTIINLISKILKIRADRIFSAMLLTEGLLLAMVAHSTFNSFLGFGLKDYAIYLIIFSAFYVYYLTQRKAGHMILASFGTKKHSLMAPKDENVILELAGMWINEEKYKEVEEICERLEKRDPDNAVIKLLHAKAHDMRRVKRAKLALASLFFQKDIYEDDVSIFERWKHIKNERIASRN